MRTTINIDEQVYLEAKKLAIESKKLSPHSLKKPCVVPWQKNINKAPVSLLTIKGDGLKHGIDLNDSQSLNHIMDVNILVYAHREDIEHHTQTLKWLELIINSNTDFGYSELVLSGFLRLVTHPRIFQTPSTLEDALIFVEQIKNQSNAVLITPKDRHWIIFKDLALSTKAVGNFIPDAYHAALAIESGSEWVTADKGFKKFKGLKIFNPLST